ncbi:MAG: fumarylacetoacetate hydrolase [Bradyrhizobium sp.]|nr:fumarylacetoacetate hydrolase [Bradyrhizobium sp.]
MKFVTFREAGIVRAGVLEGDASDANDAVFDLGHAAMRPALSGAEPEVLALLEFGLADVVRNISAHGLAPSARLPIADVALMAPIMRPNRIFGFAHNYHDALAERGMPLPPAPVLFMKEGETVVGPGEAIVLPQGIGGVTYEAELAVIIGRRAAGISKDRALDHVAAYGVFNDVSASELIRRDGHFNRGKNISTFGPFGPYIASSDEVPDPQALRVGLSVDGKTLQNGSTRDMLFDVAALVSYLSLRGTLEPGDVIATGTPAGVAPVQKPPTWLQPGMSVRTWVEGLGSLVNPVIEGPAFNG